jgi:hypothetical protein
MGWGLVCTGITVILVIVVIIFLAIPRYDGFFLNKHYFASLRKARRQNALNQLTKGKYSSGQYVRNERKKVNNPD